MAPSISVRRFMRQSLKYILPIFMIYFSIFYTPPAMARPERADRMQLFRNSDRGVPYLKLSQTGAASSSAPIVMRPVRQIALDGNPLLNVRGNLYPIHLAANGTFGFVHFNGYRFMRVYDAAGKKLWQVNNPSGRVHRDTIHRDTLAVLDADGDGDQDIVHCWVEGGKKVLMVRRGTDGTVLRRAALDNGSPNDECQIAALRVPGRAYPLILVSATNRRGCAASGNYIDTWGRTLAFDINLKLIWDRNTCAAGHYVYPVDDNADGYAGRIFIGKYLYEPDGKRVCTVNMGNTHADAVAVGDLDPSRPGMEAVLTGANGVKAVSVARNCAPIWSVPTSTIRNPQQLTMARLDANSATPTLALIERGSETNATLFLLNGAGRILARYGKNAIQNGRITAMPYQNANLDGKTGTDELMISLGRVIDRNGTLRLGTDWYWNLKSSTAPSGSPPLSSWDSWPPYPLALDLDGDGRDELVTWGRSLIVVGKAQ